jgi:hypothetical protein
MARIKLTIYEILGDYTKPFDSAQEVQAMANDIDALAGKSGSTELTAQQVMKTLGLNHMQEFRQLSAHGLKLYPSNGTWCIDSLDFRRWAMEIVERLRTKPWHDPMVEHQSKPGLF